MRGSGSNAKGRRGVLDAIERVGNALPDPVLLFAGLWVLTFLAACLLGGHQFQVPGPGGGCRWP